MSGLLDRLAGEVVKEHLFPYRIAAASRDEAVETVLATMVSTFGANWGFLNPHDDRISCPQVDGSVDIVPAAVGFAVVFHLPVKHEETVHIFWQALAESLGMPWQSGS